MLIIFFELLFIISMLFQYEQPQYFQTFDLFRHLFQYFDSLNALQ